MWTKKSIYVCFFAYVHVQCAMCIKMQYGAKELSARCDLGAIVIEFGGQTITRWYTNK